MASSLVNQARERRRREKGSEAPAQPNRTCPSCGADELSVFYEVKGVPVQSCLLLTSREEARAFPRRDIALGFCPGCGFISNVRFDRGLLCYSTTYEEQQSYSPRFNAFAKELAAHLIARYALRDKTVVEIGCGKGDFLALLCELGPNRGVGIDPSYVPGRLESPAVGRMEFLQELYSEGHARYQGDLVCCRHTLEHIDAVREFVQTVRRAIGDRRDTGVFFEVPDVTRVLREQAFWDIYYEHCSYFSLGSLARLFRSCGFEVLDLAKAFEDQYLLVEARPANGVTPARLPQEDDIEELARCVEEFAERFAAKRQAWRAQLEQMGQAGRQAVIWGSGSKCVAFLSTLGVEDHIEYVVDINPHRQGKYLPASGKQIMGPAFLQEYRPDAVIVMNPIYCEEIRQELNRMGLRPEMLAV